jgi:hypothetical protein
MPLRGPAQTESSPAETRARKDLQQVGWAEGLELAKVARRDRQGFDCATWLHKAKEMPKENFKRGVGKERTGRWEGLR